MKTTVKISSGSLFSGLLFKNNELTIIEDETARFIRLFGVMVDIDSGNIALGMFPDPSEYICIGNLKEFISTNIIGSKKKSKSIDFSYIFELLKIDPIFYECEIVDYIRDELDSVVEISKFSSVTLAISKDTFKEATDNNAKFNELRLKGEVVPTIVKHCINLFNSSENLAKRVFNKFLTENSDEEVKKNIKDKFSINSLNLESQILKYIKDGENPLLLQECKSYGYRIKERGAIFNKGTMLSKYSNIELIDIGVALSSMFYARNIFVKEKILAYNFIDMLRAVGWEENIYFSLESITEYNSKAIWESLMNKFHMYEILKDLDLSEKEFVIGIMEYKNAEETKVQSGSCYNRFVLQYMYKFNSYSIHQMKEAGMIFRTAFGMLKKNL